MYTLYWSPASANMTPHAMLEDIGVPYELIKVDTSKGEQRSPDYLKVNPHARVPTLVYDGGKIVYETTAIALFLAERHPEAGFAPKMDSPDRALFLQWMAYLTNTVQIALMHWWHPEHRHRRRRPPGRAQGKGGAAGGGHVPLPRRASRQIRPLSLRPDLLRLRLLRGDAGAVDRLHGNTRARQRRTSTS